MRRLAHLAGSITNDWPPLVRPGSKRCAQAVLQQLGLEASEGSTNAQINLLMGAGQVGGQEDRKAGRQVGRQEGTQAGTTCILIRHYKKSGKNPRQSLHRFYHTPTF